MASEKIFTAIKVRKNFYRDRLDLSYYHFAAEGGSFDDYCHKMVWGFNFFEANVPLQFAEKFEDMLKNFYQNIEILED